eukprot:11211760-Alexandrium_andersonii.AAC.1
MECRAGTSAVLDVINVSNLMANIELACEKGGRLGLCTGARCTDGKAASRARHACPERVECALGAH